MQKGNLGWVPFGECLNILFSKIQVGQNGPVPFDICVLEVIEQLFAFTNQFHQALLRGKILLVCPLDAP